MRLLAYGGTSFVERSRIGEWPPIPEGALSDTYCLPAESLVYGVGVLDRLPFLIVRQRQNVENRGGYAFTLLLDPGNEVWAMRGIEWNAARLALALFGGGNEDGLKLLSAPESFTRQEIEKLLEGLKPPPSAGCAEKAESLKSLLVGAVYRCSPIIAAPGDVGFDARPSLDCMAAALERLPPPFRFGFGWLAGGSAEQGRAFGAGLVLDEGAKAGAPEVSEWVEKGREALADWLLISEHEPGALKHHEALPVWNWETRSGWKSPGLFLKDIGVLARGIRALTPEDTDEFLASSEDETYSQGPLKDSFRRVAADKSLSGGSKLTSRQTERALREHYSGEKTITLTPHVKRLHNETLVAWLATRGLSPSLAESGLQLAWRTRLAVWRRLVLEYEQGEGVPARLKHAVADLSDGAPDEAPLDAEVSVEIRKLVGEAIERTAPSGLLLWLSAREDEVLSEWIARPLAEAAARRAREGAGDWPVEYAAFVNDPGGRLLARAGVGVEGAKRLVEALLHQAKNGGAVCEEARRWIIELAGSPLREVVPVQNKFEIAGQGFESWRWFRELWELFHEQRKSPEDAWKVSDTEREFLRKELRELIGQGVVTAVPSLSGLVELLGAMPSDDAKELSKLRPRLKSWAAAQNWIEGWRDLNYEGVYQDELERLLALAESLDDFPLGQLDEGRLRRLLIKFMFGGPDPKDRDEASDLRFKEQLKNILLLPPADGRLTAALNAAFASFEGSEREALVWARRFGSRGEVTEMLFERLGPEVRVRWVALAAETGGKQFSKEANELYAHAVKSEAALGPYERAVLEFLRTAEGEKIKNQVATWYHGIFEAEDIDHNLEKILDGEAEDGTRADGDTPGGGAPAPAAKHARRRWAGILKPYLPPILHSHLFKEPPESDEEEKGRSEDGVAAPGAASASRPESEAADDTAGQPVPGNQTSMSDAEPIRATESARRPGTAAGEDAQRAGGQK